MLKNISDKLVRFFKDEEGASAVEYGLIVGLIAVAIIIILGTLGGGLKNLFTGVSTSVTNANTTGN